jgi:hypothetical protein
MMIGMAITASAQRNAGYTNIIGFKIKDKGLFNKVMPALFLRHFYTNV